MESYTTITMSFPSSLIAIRTNSSIQKQTPEEVLSHFDIKVDRNVLSLRFNNEGNNFTGPFVISISKLVKSLVSKALQEKECSFHFDGFDAASYGLCMASSLLWEAKFAFTSAKEKQKFDRSKQQIYKQLAALTHSQIVQNLAKKRSDT